MMQTFPTSGKMKVNPEQSRILQEKLIEMGYRWINHGASVVYTGVPFIHWGEDEGVFIADETSPVISFSFYGDYPDHEYQFSDLFPDAGIVFSDNEQPFVPTRKIIGYRQPVDWVIKKGTVWAKTRKGDQYKPRDVRSESFLTVEIVETWEPVYEEESELRKAVREGMEYVMTVAIRDDVTEGKNSERMQELIDKYLNKKGL